MRMRRGFTVAEMVVVLAIMAALSAIAIPRMRPSPSRQADQWARVLAQDLDLARSNALNARARTRATISDTTWALYLDADGDGVFSESNAERMRFGGVSTRNFEDGMQLGRSGAPPLPTDPTPSSPASGVIKRLEFSASGTTEPFGAAFVIYLTNRNEPTIVRAVEVNPAANVRVWQWNGGQWE
jgi:prepilin-type N-terminal cleavage/methylation domain-containing protein